jgi:hypothetical protein
MKEGSNRPNVSDLPPEVLEAINKGNGAEAIHGHLHPEPQQHYGVPQEVPQERKPESQKKHVTQSGKR